MFKNLTIFIYNPPRLNKKSFKDVLKEAGFKIYNPPRLNKKDEFDTIYETLKENLQSSKVK